MKVIHTGDIHLTPKHRDEVARSLQHLLSEIGRENSPAYEPDLLVICGDVTDHAIQFHHEVFEPLVQFLDAVPCPIVMIEGTPTHDPRGTIQRIRKLAANGKDLKVFDKPGMIHIAEGEDNPASHSIHVAALPAITKGALIAYLTEQGIKTSDQDLVNEAIREHVRKILAGFQAEWADFKGPKLLLGHWTVTGAEASTGQTMTGGDISISLQDLVLSGADAVLLGHIHKAQHWETPIFTSYCGSIYPCNWGEREQKSFSVLNFDDETGRLLEWTRVPFPHPPMVKIEMEFDGKRVMEHEEAQLELDSQGEAVWVFRLQGEERAETLRESLLQLKIALRPEDEPILEKVPDVLCRYSIPQELAGVVDDDYIRDLFQGYAVNSVTPEKILRTTQRTEAVEIVSLSGSQEQYEAWCKMTNEEPRSGALAKAAALDAGELPDEPENIAAAAEPEDNTGEDSGAGIAAATGRAPAVADMRPAMEQLHAADLKKRLEDECPGFFPGEEEGGAE